MRQLFFLLLLLPLSLCAEVGSLSQAPALYQGRYRPAEAYARLWLKEVYGRESVAREDRKALGIESGSAVELLWKLESSGLNREAPLIAVPSATFRHWLGLPQDRRRFSYNEIYGRVMDEELSAAKAATALLLARSEDGRSQPVPGIWVEKQGDQIRLLTQPLERPWSFLTPGSLVGHGEYGEEVERLWGVIKQLERLDLWQALPSRRSPSNWLPLSQLRDKTNATLYAQAEYDSLRAAYLEGDPSLLGQELLSLYGSKLAGRSFQSAIQRDLHFPTLGQLSVERFLVRYPLLASITAIYAASLLLLLLARRRPKIQIAALSCMVAAFALHTALLTLRCYVVRRPPVATMYETLIYVPWIAIVTAFVLASVWRRTLPLILGSLTALVLLLLLQGSRLEGSLENVQAVLDSQFWLSIHVLMVVGSYGLFLLCGVLGHYYVARSTQGEWAGSYETQRLILHALYIGCGLLIAGTLLGGVWAAQSWGRFWDWDPKESWAFISSCLYLMAIHAYHFGLIRGWGLAASSVVGLAAITFTWYGVNFVLGTGLHSYGFGSGGQLFYYLYLGGEALFLLVCGLLRRRRLSLPG